MKTLLDENTWKPKRLQKNKHLVEAKKHANLNVKTVEEKTCKLKRKNNERSVEEKTCKPKRKNNEQSVE